MSSAEWALAVILVPCIGCFLIPLANLVSEKVRNGIAVLVAAITFLSCLPLVSFTMGGGSEVLRHTLFGGVDFIVIVDGLSVFMAAVSSFISLLIVIYSLTYISHYGSQTEYYLMMILFIGSMMGLVFSGNLFLMYVFWEIAGICSWRLIGFYREKDHVYKAGKAFLVTAFGAMVMLFGFIMIYSQYGTADLSALHHAKVSQIATLFILFGILSKSATLPFHTWLPDAGVAPSPVTALLHAAVLVKIGIYGFARLFCATFELPGFWETWFPYIAAASAIVAAGAAFIETDIKRIIAYSTVSQIGFILLGFSLRNEIAVTGAMLYILMHGLGKAGLFLCAGIVEQNTGTKDIRKLGGLMTNMPVTAVCFALCAFSIMGIPPFGGFFSKYQVIAGAVQADRIWVAALFILCACMTVLYLFRLFNAVFLGSHTETGLSTARERSPAMVATVVILAALSLLGGLFVSYPVDYITMAEHQMSGLLR
jgi:proton-translocating NADH-quinone oxidoreductase chain M